MSNDSSSQDPKQPPASSLAPPPGQQERRAFRRALLDRQVLIEDDRVPQPLQARNVSGGGIAVDASVELEIGTVVEVYFELPIGVAIQGNAEVVRVADGTMAFRFIDLDHEKVVALRSFCRLSGLTKIDLPVTQDE